MSTYRQLLYHIVFTTKHRQPTIKQSPEKDLYKYIWSIIKKKGCVLYRINGMEDHIHILTEIIPSISLADFVRDIKTSTSIWMKQSGKYPYFIGWGEGYCALTYTYRDKESIINYIKNQQVHHKRVSLEDEYRSLLQEHGITIDERYF